MRLLTRAHQRQPPIREGKTMGINASLKALIDVAGNATEFIEQALRGTVHHDNAEHYATQLRAAIKEVEDAAHLTESPEEAKRRATINLTFEEMRALYDSLPTTASPSEFLQGHGNAGMTEAEYRIAEQLARALEV